MTDVDFEKFRPIFEAIFRDFCPGDPEEEAWRMGLYRLKRNVGTLAEAERQEWERRYTQEMQAFWARPHNK